VSYVSEHVFHFHEFHNISLLEMQSEKFFVWSILGCRFTEPGRNKKCI